jgi:hypothetical protein
LIQGVLLGTRLLHGNSLQYIFYESEERVHLVRRSLFGQLCQPLMVDDDECGAFDGMNGRGNGITLRRPAPVPLCPPRISHDLTRVRTRPSAVRSRRLVALAMTRPYLIFLFTIWRCKRIQYFAMKRWPSAGQRSVTAHKILLLGTQARLATILAFIPLMMSLARSECFETNPFGSECYARGHQLCNHERIS